MKYYSIRVVEAEDREEAIEKVQNEEFDEYAEFCDGVFTGQELGEMFFDIDSE